MSIIEEIFGKEYADKVEYAAYSANEIRKEIKAVGKAQAKIKKRSEKRALEPRKEELKKEWWDSNKEIFKK